VATNAPTAVGITTSTSLIFVVFILLPLQASSRPDGLLVLGSGLLTGLLSRSSSVSSASPLTIPHPNMLNFNSSHQLYAHLTVGFVSAGSWFSDAGANQYVTKVIHPQVCLT